MTPVEAGASAVSSRAADCGWQTVEREKPDRGGRRPRYSGKSVSGHPPSATRFQNSRGRGERGRRGVGNRSLHDGPSSAPGTTGLPDGQKIKKSVTLTPLSSPPQYSVPLVDIGANIVGNRYFSDLSAVVSEAAQSGVGEIIVTGTSIRGSVNTVQELQEMLKRQVSLGLGGARRVSTLCPLYFTAGCHPHAARFYDDDGGIEVLKQLLHDDDSDRCVAIGECGLDYQYRRFSSPEVQQAVFRDQLALAVELKKPLFLHERSAHSDFVTILREYIHRLPVPEMACVHCFSGNREQLQTYLDLGCSIGITGFIADTRNGELMDALIGVGWEVLRERLMIESDAPHLRPYLVMPPEPQPKSGQRRRKKLNVPANLPYVCHALGVVLGVSGEEVAAATTANARRIFGLVR